MGEVAARPTDLPEALVGLLPVALQPVHQAALHPPGVLVAVEVVAAREPQGVHHLAVHVELELVHGAVADPDRRGPLVPGQPPQLALRDVALPGHPVEDLQPVRAAGDRPQQPLPPGGGLLDVPGLHQRLQGERRVAQPAVPVVPVARAAQLLRQRGRRGRDDAAGRRVGQRLEGEQRPQDGLPVRTVVAALVGPGLPEPLGLVQRVQRVDRERPGPVRRVPGEHERLALAGLDGELGVRREVPAVVGDVGGQPDRVRTGDGREHALEVAHPGDDVAVAEPQPQLAAHGDLSRDALDDADDVGGLVTFRHEVDDPDGPVRPGPLRLEHHRVAAVATARAGAAGLRRQPPVAVVLGAEQGREHCFRVEPREAQPVDRPVAADQAGGQPVGDERVVLDA